MGQSCRVAYRRKQECQSWATLGEFSTFTESQFPPLQKDNNTFSLSFDNSSSYLNMGRESFALSPKQFTRIILHSPTRCPSSPHSSAGTKHSCFTWQVFFTYQIRRTSGSRRSVIGCRTVRLDTPPRPRLGRREVQLDVAADLSVMIDHTATYCAHSITSFPLKQTHRSPGSVFFLLLIPAVKGSRAQALPSLGKLFALKSKQNAKTIS